MIITVRSLDGIDKMPVRSIIGCGDLVFESIPRTERQGMMVTFRDEEGKECKVYVRAIGKLPQAVRRI